MNNSPMNSILTRPETRRRARLTRLAEFNGKFDARPSACFTSFR
jgi:hypothetical protein